MNEIIGYFSNLQFFDIGLTSMNLFSIMVGMVIAFFNQGVFGKSIGKYIILYLVCLAAWYAGSLYIERNFSVSAQSTQVVK